MKPAFRWPIILPVLLVGTAAAAPDIGPHAASAPPRPGWHLINGRWMQPSARVEWSDLVMVSVRDGRLTIRARPSAAAEKVLRGDRLALVNVVPSPLVWTITAKGRTWEADRVTPTQHLMVAAQAGKLGPLDGLQPTSVRVTPGSVVIGASGLVSGMPAAVELTLDSPTGRITLAYGPPGGERVTVVRPDVMGLLKSNPQETRAYLVPLLRVLAGGANPLAPRAADVYTAFGHIPASPEGVAAVEWAMEGFTSDDLSVREAASGVLDRAGRPAVLAAMRLDRASLGPEQRARIEQFIARHRLYPGRGAAEYLADQWFLVDCLDDVDPAVREAARAAIERGPAAR